MSSPRLASSPPLYDAYSNLRTSSTSLKPYLELPHILSLAWLAYPIVSFLFVIFRLQLSSAEAFSSIANAKGDLLAACQAAEHAATSAASIPRYLAIATNRQFADAVNGTMDGAREALILALTCMEAIINFLISIYRSTFLCFLELVVVGGLDILISAVQEITSFLQNTLNSAISSLKNDAASLNSAIQSAVNSINKLNPFGNIHAPQFNVSSLDALSSIKIPSDFETALTKLNSSLPTVSSIKTAIEDLVDTPFEILKADINNTLLGLTFDPKLLPLPAQNSVSFCHRFDTSSIDKLGNDLLQITKIGTIILVAVLVLLLAGHSAFEWYKWRCLMRHLRFTRAAWMSDPTNHRVTPSNTVPSVTLTNHNLLMLQTDAQHPLLTRIAFALAAQLRLTPSQHIHLRWFLHYIFHPPALACFLIGFFGLLSVQIQLIAIGPLEARYNTQAAASVQDLSNVIAAQMNDSMYNQSAAYASGINAKVETVQSTINNGLFGWVNGTTTTLNSTLNNFYTDIQHIVGRVFNGTILETPAQDFIKCLIGSKVDAIEEALTFLNHNLNVNLPEVNETVLVLSPSSVNEVTQPIATAAIGGTPSNPRGLVGRLVATYVDSLKKERLMFSIFMGLWGVVVLMGLAVLFWHSYAKRWTDTYRKRKWQKEQREGLEAFVLPPKEKAPVPHVRDTEKGQSIPDPPLRSFTPLPEDHSPFSLTFFRRPNQHSPSIHPLNSLEPTFEKSWDSFFCQNGKNRQPASEGSGPRREVTRSMKFLNIGKKKGDEALEASEGHRSEDKLKSVWFWPRLFSKKGDVHPELVVNGHPPGSHTPRPQLAISVKRASSATPRAFPQIDSAPSPVCEESSSIWSVSPKPPALPRMRNIPPEKAIPLTIPPPPPSSRPWNASVPMDVGSTPPVRGPLAMPLHNSFEKCPVSPKPVHLALYPTFLASHSDTTSSRQRHSRSTTVAVPVTPPLAGHASRHESTRSTSRLLTNLRAQTPGDPVDPFATPFDDDTVARSTETKRTTNRFSGFAL